MFKKLNKKGFTLAELLVVVAIIGVLVAISIPIFSSQLEKAREATDAANIRAAYAAVSTDVLTDPGKKDTQNNVEYTAGSDGKGGTYTTTVKAVQKQIGWQSSIDKIGGQDVTVTALNGWTIEGNVEDGTVKITETK